ncbi:MAG: permease [Aquificaceae bacterium]|nr:MAG: permease [Aquificaceae bacterium]
MNIALFFENFLKLSLDAAPWLVLGLIIGGLINTIIPTAWLEKHLKGEGFLPVVKAALFGAPLPLCSCGVLPAALGLRKAGASKSATTSFLISTPETGVDSVMITYALLGPLMAITRPAAAILSAITAGLLVGKSEQGETKESAKQHSHAETIVSCCANPIETASHTSSCCSTSTANSEKDSCCGTKDNHQKTTSSLVSGIKYAFSDLLDGIIFWLFIGVLFSAAIQTWVPSDFLSVWGSGLPAMLVMIAISIPMYVCATASTPLAAGLMMGGISPGTALVFLLAGPASNIGSLGVIKKELGKRALIAYLTGVTVIAILSGLLLDWYVESNNINIQAQINASEDILPVWLSWLGLIIILVASARLLWKRYR